MRIKSNLKSILEQRGISMRQVARDIDYRVESVRQLCNDELERYPKELLEKVCEYLDLQLSDLLQSVSEEPKNT